MQMPPNMFAIESRSQQQRRRMNRSARHHHHFAFHADAMSAFRNRLHSRRRARFDSNPLRPGSHQYPRALRLRIRQPRFRGRLFRANGASISAVAANFPLIAARHISRHCVHMPAKHLEPALQHLFPR